MPKKWKVREWETIDGPRVEIDWPEAIAQIIENQENILDALKAIKVKLAIP